MRWLLFPLLLSAWSLVGCSSDPKGDGGPPPPSGGCEPRKTIFCRCATGTGEGGWKTCKADGTGYEDCAPCDGSNLEETGPGGNPTSNTPTESECGNGKVEGFEECDDGNFDDADACLSDCREARCGDGYVGPSEECDDGNDSDDDGCTTGCKAKVPASELCPGEALTVTADPAGQVVEGSFASLASNHEGSCGGVDGRDAVYSFVAPADGQVTATIVPLAGSQDNLSIYAREGSCDGGDDLKVMPTGCSNAGGPGANELIKFDVLKDGQYFVFADSQGEATGKFSLKVRFRPDEACEGQGGPCMAPGVQGTCQEGKLACSVDKTGLVCVPGSPAATDVCGDGLDNNCDGTVDENCPCSHDVCTEGLALGAACGDKCVADICEKDDFCCTNSWDDQCVSQVLAVCGTAKCVQGTCAHDICSAGGPLTIGCDGAPKCVEKICKTDGICCGKEWDSVCVSKVADICSLSCK